VTVSEDAPPVVWSPDPGAAGTSNLALFARHVRDEIGIDRDPLDYAALHSWSVANVGEFWRVFADFAGVRFHDRATTALAAEVMPHARWFEGSTLNYAEHALANGAGRGDGDRAVIFEREDGYSRSVTYGELREQVARARAGLLRAGVVRGDRVAALAPNSIETLVMFLAAASLGAIWSSCSPDFGAPGVLDRFSQIEPTVLLVVDGYLYGGREFDVTEKVRELMIGLPSVTTTVLLPYLNPVAELERTLSWSDFVSRPGTLEFEAVPFDHPLWVLYSSGTTGVPKAIVHGHGGIVLDHIKALSMHLDLGPGDRFLWFSTTGWMMWNYLIGGLLVGCTIVMFDGSPGYPDLGAQWRLVERHRITFIGVSAALVHACARAGLEPRLHYDLSSLRAVGSTGSPLSVESFEWIAESVGAELQINSLSGGTDVCAAFLGAAPTVPVWLGEVSCAWLGVAAASYADDAREVVGEVGELVILKPMPNMPLRFWNDPGDERMWASYFADFPGVWRHGDWVTRTPRGSFLIEGRSDSTLNRGGVRMGTADFYSVVESHPGVVDSLVVDTGGLAANDEGLLLCFVTLADGFELAAIEGELRADLRRRISPRHVPDRFVAVPTIPRTLTGKKCEVPVKKILAGVRPEDALSREALADPAAFLPFIEAARRAAGPQNGAA
jgi:acetoacetyl-CoA synthetase